MTDVEKHGLPTIVCSHGNFLRRVSSVYAPSCGCRFTGVQESATGSRRLRYEAYVDGELMCKNNNAKRVFATPREAAAFVDAVQKMRSGRRGKERGS